MTTAIMPPPTAGASLYERLGGRRALAVLVRNFYLSLQAHPVLGPIFAKHVVSWPRHYATLTEFWSLQAGGPSTYDGKLLRAHHALGLRPEFFEMWLAQWRAELPAALRGMRGGADDRARRGSRGPDASCHSAGPGVMMNIHARTGETILYSRGVSGAWKSKVRTRASTSGVKFTRWPGSSLGTSRSLIISPRRSGLPSASFLANPTPPTCASAPRRVNSTPTQTCPRFSESRSTTFQSARPRS